MDFTPRHPLFALACGLLLVLTLEAGAALLFLGAFGPDASRPTAEAATLDELPPMTRLGDLQGTFTDLQGNRQSFTDLRGRVVVLNLWATWCPPCLMEMPSLQELWRKVEPGGKIKVLCISEETADAVRRHRVSGLDMPLYVFDPPAPTELRAEGLPTTYIFDAGGRMVFRHLGLAKWDEPEIVKYLEELSRDGAN